MKVRVDIKTNICNLYSCLRKFIAEVIFCCFNQFVKFNLVAYIIKLLLLLFVCFKIVIKPMNVNAIYKF